MWPGTWGDACSARQVDDEATAARSLAMAGATSPRPDGSPAIPRGAFTGSRRIRAAGRGPARSVTRGASASTRSRAATAIGLLRAGLEVRPRPSTTAAEVARRLIASTDRDSRPRAARLERRRRGRAPREAPPARARARAGPRRHGHGRPDAGPPGATADRGREGATTRRWPTGSASRSIIRTSCVLDAGVSKGASTSRWGRSITARSRSSGPGGESSTGSGGRRGPRDRRGLDRRQSVPRGAGRRDEGAGPAPGVQGPGDQGPDGPSRTTSE